MKSANKNIKDIQENDAKKLGKFFIVYYFAYEID